MDYTSDKQYYFKSSGEKVINLTVINDSNGTYLTASGEFGDTVSFPAESIAFNLEEKLTKTSNNINNDIIKLIESGYEFKTFWGTTFNGKEFHIEMQLEEDDKAFKFNEDDYF